MTELPEYADRRLLFEAEQLTTAEMFSLTRTTDDMTGMRGISYLQMSQPRRANSPALFNNPVGPTNGSTRV